MNGFAALVQETVRSLEKLRGAVIARRACLRAGEGESVSQVEILKYLNTRPTSSLTLEKHVEKDEGDPALHITETVQKP